jgi:hypothetical protein
VDRSFTQWPLTVVTLKGKGYCLGIERCERQCNYYKTPRSCIAANNRGIHHTQCLSRQGNTKGGYIGRNVYWFRVRGKDDDDLPTKAEVHCSDGAAGRSTYVIVNPINRQMTHLVVKSSWPPFHEYLVPVDQVEETTPDLIRLKCTRNDLSMMEPLS